MLKGLDQLQRHLKEAEEVLKRLDGDLCTVAFDPNDPSSIEEAIQQIETVIDECTGRYASNPIIKPLAAEMKERYRTEIVERAAAARLEAGN
jgi:predicted RNase H-like HicB family nuclease